VVYPRVMLQRAGIAEVEVLAAIMARCFRSNYTGLISEAAFEADLAIAALTERVRSYLQRKVSETWAIRDGEGFVSFGASRDADATPQVGEVYALFVEPGQQGRGQGGELLLHAQGRLAALGYREATLWVLDGQLSARRFYEGAGWLQDGGRTSLSFGGRPLAAVRYRRDLGNAPVHPLMGVKPRPDGAVGAGADDRDG
jgi:ribosomal protein S18 acetylase RimI-like enzyme